jgi:hypothetical protein
MAASHIFRLAAMKGKTVILDALKHNKRTLQAERGAGANIDASKSHLNYSLTGSDTPEKIATHAKVQMVKAGIDKPRSNQVMGVEVLFSLPIDRHSHDTRQFFKDCFEWVRLSFKGELLSFDIHLDESAPHAHAVILPLDDGKMQGSKMIGNKGNLMRLINKFHTEVARHHGLSRNKSKQLSPKDKYSLSKLILIKLKTDPVMKSSIYPCVRDLIVKDPFPFAQTLSITPTAKKLSVKSFVDHKRSKGKGRFIS